MSNAQSSDDAEAISQANNASYDTSEKLTAFHLRSHILSSSGLST